MPSYAPAPIILIKETILMSLLVIQLRAHRNRRDCLNVVSSIAIRLLSLDLWGDDSLGVFRPEKTIFVRKNNSSKLSIINIGIIIITQITQEALGFWTKTAVYVLIYWWYFPFFHSDIHNTRRSSWWLIFHAPLKLGLFVHINENKFLPSLQCERREREKRRRK